VAIIWQKSLGSNRYQVRKAGASIRLYTNGVFHSQFNPNSPLGGSIWDLLILPALFAPQTIQRILVLGLGGGAAVRALQILLPERDITAIEIDPVHLHIAKKFFGVKPNKKTALVKADAIAWLQQYKGQPFDFILDDLFIETDGQPDRAVDNDNKWSRLLLRHLSPRGVLAINFDRQKALKNAAITQQSVFRNSFSSRFTLLMPGYDNRIAALFKQQFSRQDLQSNLRDLENTFGKRITRRLKIQIRSQ